MSNRETTPSTTPAPAPAATPNATTTTNTTTDNSTNEGRRNNQRGNQTVIDLANKHFAGSCEEIGCVLGLRHKKIDKKLTFDLFRKELLTEQSKMAPT